MKKISTIIICLMIFSQVNAQMTANEEEMFKSMFNMEKKLMVENFMQLNDADAQKFWPIYNNYETERGDLTSRRIKVLKQYADQYSTLTDEQADVLMKEVFSIRKKDLALKQKYFNQIKKNMSAKTATSFYQLEEYIQTAIRYSLLEQIPFVGEM
ncbi:MAG: hypothetical protein O7F74_07970 [Bacteroidetes bacterium]|nr:hypothetical protein [Bacteroidota bacterium]